MVLGKVPVMTVEVPRTDRRHVRRAETIDQLLEVAVQVMAEQGAGGLSLGEVARRMGIRPPSLYVYFASKNAVYDAVFAQGWRQVTEVMKALPVIDVRTDPEAALQAAARAFVRWSVEHPVHSQLMLWRPVPNWEPSPEAFAPAVLTLELTRERIATMRRLGLLRDVALDELVNAWTAINTGVISRQLANGPHEPFASGSFTSVLPALVSMYATHYRATPPHSRRNKKP
jgi:AcrR family transcriptional regulator